MKTPIILFLAPFLASAAVLLENRGNNLDPRSYRVSCPETAVKLDDKNLQAARQKFQKQRKGKVTDEVASVTDGSVKVYICNNNPYLGKILDGGRASVEVTDKKVANWMATIDKWCGPGNAGHMDAPVADGNFGRAAEGDKICDGFKVS
ncbi:unnamed protein product [Periconia digitata]|uniref:Uncharacterized protein n=1 Tax=Periconia digitata TaxID=1303443 RepID=A0A9W4US00_9PLEO|nr:unnamed protein product [Periconia digitata]